MSVFFFAFNTISYFQLIEDSRDCLEAAIRVKNSYIDFIKLTTTQPVEEIVDLGSFEDRLCEVFLVMFYCI